MKQSRTVVNLNEKHVAALKYYTQAFIRAQEALGNVTTIPMMLDFMYEKAISKDPTIKVTTPVMGRPRIK